MDEQYVRRVTNDPEFSKVTFIVEDSKVRSAFLIPFAQDIVIGEVASKFDPLLGLPPVLQTMSFEFSPIPNKDGVVYYHTRMSKHRLDISALGNFDQQVSCLDCDYSITLNASPTLSELNIISDEHNREFLNG